MRIFTLLLSSLASISAISQSGDSTELRTALPGTAQHEYFLDRAERLGWKEDESGRAKNSSSFTAPDGKKIIFNSVAEVNFKPSGKDEWVPVDIRPKAQDGKFTALQQPFPLEVNADGSVSYFINGSNASLFSATKKINGSLINHQVRGRKDGLHVWFDNIASGVSKQIEFRYGGFKYNYVLNQPVSVNGNAYIIREEMQFPEGVSVTEVAPGESVNGERIIVRDAHGKILAGIYALFCYDQSGATCEGKYTLVKKPGTSNLWTLELSVPGSWITSSARSFPLIIDPLVTGPVTTWSGGFMPSCFFPSYNVDSILITVPAAITVTNLDVTASYYADPFTTTVMADGRMYFSTTCNQSTIFQVQPPAGNTAGTAYLQNFNLKSPLMCCHPQQCTSYSFYLRMHISRTTNGSTCNTTYLYYNPTTSWPFSAFVEGYTPESYGTGMQFVPATVCANTCQVTANIYAHYGVPPFTYTHPWSASSVTFGNPVGCSTGNFMKQLQLDIPNCPNYCDPNTGLTVPPPVVTDACGAVVQNYAASYTLNITPVSLVTPAQDTLITCSGYPAIIPLNDCLGGSQVNWWGGNQTDTTHFLYDTIINTSGGPQPYTYIILATSNGCPVPNDTAVVIVYPGASQDFSTTPDPPITNNVITFTDNTQYFGNNPLGWFWTFGDSTGSLLQSPGHIFTEPGDYTVCFYATTPYGCSDTICKIIQVVPANLELPNVISPNGDGANDALYIKYLEQYPTNLLQVFNRWGNLIYEKENYQNDWKADNVADGTYYYILNLPGDKNYHQFLHIMRTK